MRVPSSNRLLQRVTTAAARGTMNPIRDVRILKIIGAPLTGTRARMHLADATMDVQELVARFQEGHWCYLGLSSSFGL